MPRLPRQREPARPAALVVRALVQFGQQVAAIAKQLAVADRGFARGRFRVRRRFVASRLPVSRGKHTATSNPASSCECGQFVEREPELALGGLPAPAGDQPRPAGRTMARSVVHSTTPAASTRSISAPITSRNSNSLAAAWARTTPASVLRSVIASAASPARPPAAPARRGARPLRETKSSFCSAARHSARPARGGRDAGGADVARKSAARA